MGCNWSQLSLGVPRRTAFVHRGQRYGGPRLQRRVKGCSTQVAHRLMGAVSTLDFAERKFRSDLKNTAGASKAALLIAYRHRKSLVQ